MRHDGRPPVRYRKRTDDLREWPDDAATLLAALVRWREEHRQAGTQLESRAEVHYEAELREKLGDKSSDHPMILTVRDKGYMIADGVEVEPVSK